MEFNNFQTLSVEKIAQIVKQKGRKVLAFPFNGTRRWFYLEKRQPGFEDLSAYHDAITTRQIELSTLIFEHGIDTLLMPLLSPRLFESRGAQYTKTAVNGLSYLTDQPKFLTFYKQMDVRVRFYGAYKNMLNVPEYEEILNKINQLEEGTAMHKSHHLYWGVCAHDTIQTVSDLTLEYFKKYHKQPTRQELIIAYYGQSIESVDIFLTASKFRMFDIPMLLTGSEDLYFTMTPSPYLNQNQFREILFDHLFTRSKTIAKYEQFDEQEWQALRNMYKANQQVTYGVGRRLNKSGIWIPKLTRSEYVEPPYAL